MGLMTALVSETDVVFKNNVRRISKNKYIDKIYLK